MNPTRQQRWWVTTFEWSAIFAINLVVPLYLGVGLTRYSGMYGMATAVAACWLAGLIVCLQSRQVREVLFMGGFRVALSQFVPILQVASGMFGLYVWESSVGSPRFESGPMGEIGGFAVTLLTAGPLLLAAWVFGGGLWLLFGGTKVEGPEAADYGEPDKPNPSTQQSQNANS